MSRLAVFVASAILLVCPATLVRAQSWEASGLVGYTPSSALDRRAPELSQLDLSGGFTWGVQGARFFTPHWGAEALWMQQSSAQRIGTAAGSADLFTLTAGQLHGNVVYRFGGADARLQPFAFAGLGATFFRSDDVPSETKFSLGFGGGVKYFFFRLRWRARARSLHTGHAQRHVVGRLLRSVRILSGNAAPARVRRRRRRAFLDGAM